ncbi:hypothetical protein AAY473_029047 [Plecturocebus cupreus]
MGERDKESTAAAAGAIPLVLLTSTFPSPELVAPPPCTCPKITGLVLRDECISDRERRQGLLLSYRVSHVKLGVGQARWLTHVIPAFWEAEVGRS